MNLGNEQDYICLVWKDNESRRRFKVGKLTRNDEYQFSYGLEVNEAIKNGFQPLIAFDDFKKTYTHHVLFPSFASRLPDRKRKDIDEILKKYGVDKFDEYELLKKSGARLPIDTLEFVEPILDGEKEFIREFYLAGTRYYLSCGGRACGDSIDVKVEEELVLKHEPTNEYDMNAIKVLNSKDEHLGYIPRYYCERILDHLKDGYSYKIIVKRVEKSTSCDECIFVELSIN